VDWEGLDRGGRHWHAWKPSQPWRADWDDDTPGATPHTPPLVTDKEWSADAAWDAWDAWVRDDPTGASAMSAAIAAAFAIRDKEQTDD